MANDSEDDREDEHEGGSSSSQKIRQHASLDLDVSPEKTRVGVTNDDKEEAEKEATVHAKTTGAVAGCVTDCHQRAIGEGKEDSSTKAQIESSSPDYELMGRLKIDESNDNNDLPRLDVSAATTSDNHTAVEPSKLEHALPSEGKSLKRPAASRRERWEKEIKDSLRRSNKEAKTSTEHRDSMTDHASLYTESMTRKSGEALGQAEGDDTQYLGEAREMIETIGMNDPARGLHRQQGSSNSEKGALTMNDRDSGKGALTMASEVDPPRRGRACDIEVAATPGASYAPGRPAGQSPGWSHGRNQACRPSGSAISYPTCPGTEDAVQAFAVDERAQEEIVRRKIIGETVEADVVDDVDVPKKQKYQLLIFSGIAIVLASIAVGLGVALSHRETTIVTFSESPTASPSFSPTETLRPTLEKVIRRGVLRCGVSNYEPGLYAFNETTNSKDGFNVDLCRSIATAAMNDSSKIEMISLTSRDRFLALLNGDVDVLTRYETHTMSREISERTTGAGFSFSSPFLYSGLVFSGEPTFVDCAEQLETYFDPVCSQLRICVYKDTSLEEVSERLIPSAFLVKVESTHIMELFANGTCNVVATEPVYGHEAVFRAAGYMGDLKLGTTLFSREPLAMVTRQGDSEWSDLVNAVIQALLAAEVDMVTQSTAEHFKDIPTAGRFREGMFRDIIAAVGNYGQIFSRHLDHIVPRSGLNSLDLDGSTGLLYSLPFGNLRARGPGLAADGLLPTILDRGYLRCAVSANASGFSEFNTSSQEWAGLDVRYCHAISAAIFGDDIFNTTEFLAFPDEERYLALETGDADVLAGGAASFSNDVLQGFSLSLPYFYGSTNGNSIDNSARALITRDDDNQWSTFVDWTLTATIFAEEMSIGRTKSHLMPAVHLFGDDFLEMFRNVIAAVGNYAEIYENSLGEKIPREGRNQLNRQPYGPQQLPYLFP